MKKAVKVLSLVLVFVMAATMFVSCASQYSKLQKAFEAEGYEENATFTEVADKVKAELEKEEYAVELHLLTKKGNGVTSVLIVEFKTTEDMVNAYKNSETVKGLVKDISSNEDVNKIYDALKNAGYANGNCLCVPMSVFYINEITTIVKSVK